METRGVAEQFVTDACSKCATPSPGPPRLRITPVRSTLSPKGERGNRSISAFRISIFKYPLLQVLVKPLDSPLGNVPLVCGLPDHMPFIRINDELAFHAGGS